MALYPRPRGSGQHDMDSMRKGDLGGVYICVYMEINQPPNKPSPKPPNKHPLQKIPQPDFSSKVRQELALMDERRETQAP